MSHKTQQRTEWPRYLCYMIGVALNRPPPRYVVYITHGGNYFTRVMPVDFANG